MTAVKTKKHLPDSALPTKDPVPEEIKQMITELVKFCPFRKVEIQNWDRLPVRLLREADGWQFVCEVCSPTACTGFFPDSVSPEHSD